MSFPDFGPADANSLLILERLNSLYPSRERPNITYNELITLAVSTAPRTEWDFWDVVIDRLGILPQTNHWLDSMVSGVFNYYRDNVLPTLIYMKPTRAERAMLEDLNKTVLNVIQANPENLLETLTYDVYECGKRHYEPSELRNFFKSVYEVCLGRSEGPRLPNFIILYGMERWTKLVDERLNSN